VLLAFAFELGGESTPYDRTDGPVALPGELDELVALFPVDERFDVDTPPVSFS
jgi:hypothetical protein